ncbi:sigma-70 family RNA polymerase sigma factor [Verrucomicrobiaceae bacterium 227]
MASSDQIKNSLDQGDFMRLLMRHEPALRAYSRSLLPNWNLVDEVIQEASLTLWQKFDQLKDEDGFLPWSKVVVRFKCLSAISKLRRDRHVFSDGVLELLAEEAESFDVQEREQSMHALRSCLNTFSHAHQELLLAPYTGDGQVTTLAREANKSANSLYKLLGRLREKLATCIQAKLPQDSL